MYSISHHSKVQGHTTGVTDQLMRTATSDSVTVSMSVLQKLQSTNITKKKGVKTAAFLSSFC